MNKQYFPNFEHENWQKKRGIVHAPAGQTLWSCKLQGQLQNLQDFHKLDEEISNGTKHWVLQNRKLQKQTKDFLWIYYSLHSNIPVKN